MQALASTNELGPTGLPLVVSSEASDPADVQVVGRTEASGPANAQVVGPKESLVANAEVLQAPPLGAAHAVRACMLTFPIAIALRL